MLRMGRHNVIPSIMQVRTFAPASAAVAASWWVVAGATCVAAYQPKGAASYAASKVNLANSGTYDAGDGAAYPSWDTSTGWTFNGSSQYLTTGISHPGTTAWSTLIRYSGTNGALVGARNGDAVASFIIQLVSAASFTRIRLEATQNNIGYSTGGVLGYAGTATYFDGAPQGAASDGTTVNDNAMTIGAEAGTTARYTFYSGSILAVVIYSSALSAAEVATVSTAMAAL